MQKLKDSFLKTFSKFEKNKSLFKHKVDRWSRKFNQSWYRKGKALLDQLEKEGDELKDFFSDATAVADEKIVRAKLRSFKKAYKNLYNATKPEWRQWIEALIIAGGSALLLRNLIFGLYHVPTGSAEPTVLVGDRVWGNKLAYSVFGMQTGTVKKNDLVIFDEPGFKYDTSNPIKKFWQKYVGFPIPLLGLGTGPINVVKRVIATPGDWIEGRMENDKPVIYINNKKLDEPYVNKFPLIWLKKDTGFLPFNNIGPFALPSFLRKEYKGVWYTYVPEVSFEEQPYYSMDKSDVVRIPGLPYLKYAETPSFKDVDRIENADIFGPMRVPEGKYWVMGDSRKNSQDSRWFGFLDDDLVHGRLSFIIYSIDSQEPFWLFELIKHPISFWINGVRWNRFFKIPSK